MNSEHLQEAMTVLSRALPQISFDPNQPIAFTKAVVQHLQAQKQQHESDLQVMNERMTESIDRMLWRITELRNELRALQSERRSTAQPESAAELPEPEPILAPDGRSLVEVAKQARLSALARNGPGAKCDEAAAQAVANVVLAQAIRRMEAVSHSEISNAYWQEGDGYENIRSRLIAAASGEALGINGLTEAEETKTASVSGLSKPISQKEEPA